MKKGISQVIAPDGYNRRHPDGKGNVSVSSNIISLTGNTMAKDGRTDGKGYCIYQKVDGKLVITIRLSEDGQKFSSVVDLITMGRNIARSNSMYYWNRLA